jgi:HAE1 family hydrophobic/amphiphilic exporter-1
MNMTQTAIKRGVTFAMIYLIAAGFGLFSLIRLNVDLYPKLNFPYIAIISQYTGVGPFDIETVVTRPIEEAVASVENMKSVTSTTREGLSIVMLEFKWGTDMNQAEIDVRNSLEFIRDYLPDDASDPMVFPFDISTQPILYLALSSDVHDQAQLRHIGEHDFEPRLERIPGVASAFTMGGMQREIRVLVDPGRMRAHNVSIQQISGALQAANLQIPSGYIDDERLEFSIQTAGEFTNIDQIANTSVAVYNGAVIHVKDVARVEDGFKDSRERVWNNGKSAVMVMLQKQSDANTVLVCRDVLKQLNRIESELPKGIHIETVIDLSAFITRSMSNLGSTAWQAVLLTFLVLLFFLRNVRSSFIVAVSIPISVFVTFAVMDQAGITLNVISMAGLALAIGMLVDNSIVVLESIFRHHDELKENLRDSAFKGTQEVGMAVTAATLTTLVVFIPVLFVPGLAGQLFKDMVLTICVSLTVSLIVSLTLVPLMASRILRIRRNLAETNWMTRASNRIGNWFEDFQKFYHKVLDWSLFHRKTVLLTTFALFVLSIITLVQLGGEFLPHTDQGFLQITVDRSAGTSVESMEKSMRELNQIISQDVPEAENIYMNFGQGEGVYALFSTRSSAEGDLTVRLKNLSDRKRHMNDIQDDIRPKLDKIPDVEAKFQDRGEAMFSAADIVLKVIGHDLSRAEILSNQIEKQIKDIKGVASITSSVRQASPELRINLDRQRIADLGLNTAAVGQAVSTSILGSVATRYREKGDEYDVRVQLDKTALTNKEDLDNILIMTPLGKQVPLRAIATIEYSKAPNEISREDQERIVTLNVDVSGRDLQSVTRDVKEELKKVIVPNDFRTELGGAAQDMIESFMYLGLAFLVAMILCYMVMASQFESLLDPFIIMFTIPLSIIGVALGLVLTGTDMNVMALIGIIMLVGIVVNNGIVLVDCINQLRAGGMEMRAAIKEGGRLRMRPVLMTALTTVLGMLPLALGVGESGETWAPMARAVMGGLTVATALTLNVVPVIYSVIEDLTEKIQSRKKAREARRLGKGIISENA